MDRADRGMSSVLPRCQSRSVAAVLTVVVLLLFIPRSVAANEALDPLTTTAVDQVAELDRPLRFSGNETCTVAPYAAAETTFRQPETRIIAGVLASCFSRTPAQYTIVLKVSVEAFYRDSETGLGEWYLEDDIVCARTVYAAGAAPCVYDALIRPHVPTAPIRLKFEALVEDDPKDVKYFLLLTRSELRAMDP